MMKLKTLIYYLVLPGPHHWPALLFSLTGLLALCWKRARGEFLLDPPSPARRLFFWAQPCGLMSCYGTLRPGNGGFLAARERLGLELVPVLLLASLAVSVTSSTRYSTVPA